MNKHTVYPDGSVLRAQDVALATVVGMGIAGIGIAAMYGVNKLAEKVADRKFRKKNKAV